MLTTQNELNLAVLEHIYDNSSGSEPASVGGLRDRFGDDDTARTCVSLTQRGLIRADDRLSGGYHLTASGREELEARQLRRRDRGFRRKLCRNELLRWLDNRGASDPAHRVSRGDFDAAPDGEPFTDQESAEAADYLNANELVGSISASGGPHILMWTSDLGRECIDSGGNVDDFLTRRRGRDASQIINITGSGNTVAAALGDRNVVSASLEAFDLQQALRFAEAVRQALPTLDLDTAEVVARLDEIERADSPTKAQHATAVLQTMLANVSTSTLSQVLAALGAAALGIG